MVIVVPSTVTVPLSLVTTVVPLKVIVVVELSESLSSDSVAVVSVAESEALLVNTEAVSNAVASVVLELVLELVFSSALFVSDAEVSLVVLSAVSKEPDEAGSEDGDYPGERRGDRGFHRTGSKRRYLRGASR